MEAEEIDYFLLHQANDRMLDKMSKKLGVSREKIPANMMEYGNTKCCQYPHSIIGVCRESSNQDGWKSKNSSDRIRWRFDMGHTSCYNLVKHVETHFKNLYIIFYRLIHSFAISTVEFSKRISISIVYFFNSFIKNSNSKFPFPIGTTFISSFSIMKSFRCILNNFMSK